MVNEFNDRRDSSASTPDGAARAARLRGPQRRGGALGHRARAEVKGASSEMSRLYLIIFNWIELRVDLNLIYFLCDISATGSVTSEVLWPQPSAPDGGCSPESRTGARRGHLSHLKYRFFQVRVIPVLVRQGGAGCHDGCSSETSPKRWKDMKR